MGWGNTHPRMEYTMIPIDLSSFTANVSSPRYDPAYPTGNRSANGTLMATANLTSGTLPPVSVLDGVTWGSDGGPAPTIVNGELVGVYNPTTNAVYGISIDTSKVKASDVYVTFRAKMPGTKFGSKFLKFFGDWLNGNGSNYANCTFMCDYTGVADGYGTMYAASFGDGTDTANDSNNIIAYHFADSTPSTRNAGATILTPQNKAFTAADWGTGFHDFRFRFKFNSGTTAQNEVADGAIYVEIDGLVYLDATNLFTRHWSNNNYFYRIELFGYSNNPPAFTIVYDDIKIAMGGWPA